MRWIDRVGDAIRIRWLALGLFQEALADAAGIDRSHKGEIERGERNDTMLNLVRVADILRRSPSEIMLAAGL